MKSETNPFFSLNLQNFDELKLKLQYTTIELESVKMETNEQIRKYREEVKYLLNLLKLAYQERDEARNQLQKLLNKLMPSSPTELQPILPHPQSESPLMFAAKANSSITESSSLSDTYNNHQQSHVSTPVDSFFDSVTSPDFSRINMADSGGMGFVNQPLVQEYNGSVSTGLVSSVLTKVVDPAATVIDNLAKGKTLPQKESFCNQLWKQALFFKHFLLLGPFLNGEILLLCKLSKSHLFPLKVVILKLLTKNQQPILMGLLVRND